jgi:molecular chaperone GrpE
MADSTKKVSITEETDEDGLEDEAAQPDRRDDYYDDGDRKREPINLDTPVVLADALASLSAQSAAEGPNGRKAVRPTVSIPANLVEPPPPAPTAPAEPQLGPTASNGAEIEKLRADLKQANENYLRALADLQNFRRRGEEERLRIVRNGNEKLIKEILPVLDDFDLALDAAKQAESFEQLVGGVDAIVRKFHETLSKQGVEPIASVGEKFDPDLHEAVMVDENSEEPDETVVSELRKGYTLHNRVIRPSLVKVAKGG